jgi:hypothetical protein
MEACPFQKDIADRIQVIENIADRPYWHPGLEVGKTDQR